MTNQSLSDERALIIGGSSGIGEAAAGSLQALGAAVTICSRDRGTLDAAAARIGGSVETAVLDTHDNEAIEAFFAGRPPFDHIVVSAARTPGGPVRVNTVSPGVIATPLWAGMPEDQRRKMFDATAAGLPARRIGQPGDVANAIAYLVTTPYATGSTVLVDGGGAIA